MFHLSYSGEEAFDLILYMARTLTKLKYRVLIIDLSDSGAMKRAIHHGMDLDSSEHIVNYRDINYTRKIPSDEEMTTFGPGVVIFNFGYKLPKKLNCRYDENIVILNTFPHVVEKINDMMQGKDHDPEKLTILIRDIFSIDDVERIKKTITFPYREEKNYYFFHDDADYENAINIMNKQIVDFTGISASMENFIIKHIQKNFPNHSILEIKRALKAARKGR